MNKLAKFTLLLILVLCLAPAAQAEVIPFDNPVITGAQAPGVWYTDRYAPATFEQASFMGDNRLHIGISGQDVQSNSWYNYQGRKYDFGDSITAAIINADLYVDAGWGMANVGIWATTFDDQGDVAGYPIVSWRQSDTTAAGFYAYDYIVGAWVALSGSYTPGSWYNIQFRYTGTHMNYYIDGQLALSFADATQNGTWGNIILNTYNTGQDMDVYWDNVGTTSAEGETPEPGTMLLFGSAAGALGWFRRRKAQK